MHRIGTVSTTEVYPLFDVRTIIFDADDGDGEYRSTGIRRNSMQIGVNSFQIETWPVILSRG
jgi:hypothetical protein